MIFHTKALVAPASVAAGAAIIADRFTDKTVLISGTFDATCRVQGSVDGATWVDLTGDITAPGAHPIAHTIRLIRINTTVYVSGAIVASFSGLDARST